MMRKRSKSVGTSQIEYSKIRTSLLRNEDVETEPRFEDPDGWTPEENLRIIQKVLRQIPKNDNLPYDQRFEEIKWKKIADDKDEVEDTKQHFENLLEKTRNFRLLSEMLLDLQTSTISILHLPKKPASVFALFVEDNKELLKRRAQEGGRGSFARVAGETFKQLSDEDREKYKIKFENMKQDYKNILAKYDLDDKPSNTSRVKKDCPYIFFWQHKKQRNENFTQIQAKEFYSKLSRRKKLKWILQFLHVNHGDKLNLEQYELARNTLTREEMSVIDEYEERPKKINAYNLFIQDYLKTKKGDDIIWTNNFKTAVNKWKKLPVEERNHYEQLAKEIKDEYDTNYLEFIKSLEPCRQSAEVTKMLEKKVKKRKTKSPVDNNRTRNQSYGNSDITLSTSYTKSEQKDSKNISIKTDVSAGMASSSASLKTPFKKRKIKNKSGLEHSASDGTSTEETTSKPFKFLNTIKKEKNKLNTSYTSPELLTPKKELRKRKYSETILESSANESMSVKTPSRKRGSLTESTFSLKKPPSSAFKYYVKELYNGPKIMAKENYKELSTKERKSIKAKYKKATQEFLDRFKEHVQKLPPGEIEKFAELVNVKSEEELSDLTDSSFDSD